LKCWERSAKAEDEGIYRYDEVLLQRKIIPELQSAAAALSDEREVTLSTTDDVAAAAQPDKRLPYIRA